VDALPAAVPARPAAAGPALVRGRRHPALAGRPGLALDLAGRPLGEFRGAIETGRHDWLAWDGGTAVGYIGCTTTDRWTTWDGSPGGGGVTATIGVPAANVSYVVAPARRRRGYGTAMIGALLARPELAHVRLFAAGVEPANTGSVQCLRSNGFAPLDPEPDWEGTVYYARLKAAAAAAARPHLCCGRGTDQGGHGIVD
jgi:GNAT superfamily N-acetyltransferase